MSYFKNPNFNNARATVVGNINSLTVDERWERETQLFSEAIMRHIPSEPCAILDFGCGIGRISKTILALHPTCTIVGADNSDVQLQHARGYINHPRFTGVFPNEVEGRFDLAFSLYVLQHVRALHLRQALQIIHANLAPEGLFIQGCSLRRMAVRDDLPQFLNDGFLGVDVMKELDLFFEPIGDLFTPDDFEKEPLLRKIVLGEIGQEEPGGYEVFGEPHPTRIYRKRELEVPYWRLPMP